MVKGGSLYEFLKEKNGTQFMQIFVQGCIIIQCVIIGLTIARAAFEGMSHKEEYNGYATAVAVINAFNTAYIVLDVSCWQFTNSVSLLFVIVMDSICIAANVLICFVPGDVRVLSFFVLAFSFILHAMIISFVLSTLVRKITSHDNTADMHKSSIETAVASLGTLQEQMSRILEIDVIKSSLGPVTRIDTNSNNVFS